MTNMLKMRLVAVTCLILISLVMLLSGCSQSEYPPTDKLRNGDVIFQSLNSSAGAAIRLATESEFSHVGLLFQQNKKWFVYEAIGPVKLTPLHEWIDRGLDGTYEVKRLRDATELLSANVLRQMRTVGEQLNGKPYDLQFKWSDARMYCSELVWKVYQRGAGVTLGNLRPLKDFQLDDPLVRAAMQKRYGENPPYDEMMIAPATIYECDELETVLKS